MSGKVSMDCSVNPTEVPRGQGPLKGLKVLDSSMGAVGPWAGALLGQLGADVVKLEGPQGDFIHNIMPTMNGLSSTYISMNVNKRLIIRDLKTPEQRAEVHELVRKADVFIENFRPGVADRIGLGYAELSAIRPELVYASASGFGKTGPMAPIGATDPHIQAFSGSTSVNGLPSGLRQRWRWYGHFDCTTSLCIVQGILTALADRQQTGRGRLVEVTMVAAAIALQRVRLAEHLSGGNPRPMGSATTYLVPDQAFQTKDRHIAISVTSRRQWNGFCTAVGLPDLASDLRFDSNPKRIENRSILIPLLERAFIRLPAARWLQLMARHGVPCALFSSFVDFQHHSHYRDNGMLTTFDTLWGPLTLGGLPWMFEQTPGSLWPSSAPGGDTEAIISRSWPDLADAGVEGDMP